MFMLICLSIVSSHAWVNSILMAQQDEIPKSNCLYAGLPLWWCEVSRNGWPAVPRIPWQRRSPVALSKHFHEMCIRFLIWQTTAHRLASSILLDPLPLLQTDLVWPSEFATSISCTWSDRQISLACFQMHKIHLQKAHFHPDKPSLLNQYFIGQ